MVYYRTISWFQWNLCNTKTRELTNDIQLPFPLLLTAHISQVDEVNLSLSFSIISETNSLTLTVTVTLLPSAKLTGICNLQQPYTSDLKPLTACYPNQLIHGGQSHPQQNTHQRIQSEIIV